MPMSAMNISARGNKSSGLAIFILCSSPTAEFQPYKIAPCVLPSESLRPSSRIRGGNCPVGDACGRHLLHALLGSVYVDDCFASVHVDEDPRICCSCS